MTYILRMDTSSGYIKIQNSMKLILSYYSSPVEILTKARSSVKCELTGKVW